ncbi:MAG TPA: hypothetical protein VFG00_04250, partial [Acidothermaceae bacterium]|nr:hypothetical protein [Acidothermaceae bacterium]
TGTSTGSSTAATTTETTAQHDILTTAVGRARTETAGRNASTARARGTTDTSGRNWSNSQNRGGSKTYRQTLVPRIKTREIVTSVQFLTTDEQTTMVATEQATLPIGCAHLYVSGQGVSRVQFPLAKDPFPRTPTFAKKKLTQLERLVTARPEYATPDAIATERQNLLQRLVMHLDAIADEHPLPPVLPADDDPQLGI